MRLKHFMVTAALAAIVLVSCTDDDEQSPGTIGISATAESYNEGDGTIELTITTTETYTTDLTITYTVSGTATAGEDFEILSGTVVIAAGETSITQDIVITDDQDVEGEEALIITITAISNTTGIIGSSNTLTLTIVDNDSYPFENGLLVSHEGNFGQGNASVSFISEDLATVENGIFKSVNNVSSMGDTAQSIAFNGDYAYIVLNVSAKIEVVNRYTFVSVATIGGTEETDFLNPRYMTFANGKGYVTNWGDGSNPDDDYIAVINLESNTVASTIAVAEGPERIIAKDNVVYVAMQGGYNQNNIISVIDATTDALTTTIAVGDRPNSLQLDADGALWVISGGNPSWTGAETAGQLDEISTTDNTVVSTLTFATTEHPSMLNVNVSSLYYYLGAAVYKVETSATSLPTVAEISELSFYGMAVLEGKLYGVDAKDYSSNGSLEVYNLTTNTLEVSKEVSIIPGGIYFNE